MIASFTMSLLLLLKLIIYENLSNAFQVSLGPRVVFSYITIVIMTIFIAIISLYEEINDDRSGLICNMGLVVYEKNCR